LNLIFSWRRGGFLWVALCYLCYYVLVVNLAGKLSRGVGVV
jgi:hypothetical protein